MEKIAIPLLLTMSILFINIYLANRTTKKTANLQELYDRVIFSTSTLKNPAVRANLLFDRDISTSWWDEVPGADLKRGFTLPLPENMQNELPDKNSLYIVMELGLTHFPGRPPIRNRLKELLIWSGNQKNRESFFNFARPKKIHLLFFAQKLVDVDRDYAIPGLPEILITKTLVLKDQSGVQKVNLDFLPAAEESSRFPENIAMIWLRIVTESYYPGRRYRKRVAISEIDFTETFKTHATVSNANKK